MERKGLNVDCNGASDDITANKSNKSDRLASIPKELLKGARDVARKAANLGKRRGSKRQPTNPIALAALRVYKESIIASKKAFHIVSTMYDQAFNITW
jgi:hypothetical protein